MVAFCNRSEVNLSHDAGAAAGRPWAGASNASTTPIPACLTRMVFSLGWPKGQHYVLLREAARDSTCACVVVPAFRPATSLASRSADLQVGDLVASRSAGLQAGDLRSPVVVPAFRPATSARQS